MEPRPAFLQNGAMREYMRGAVRNETGRAPDVDPTIDPTERERARKVPGKRTLVEQHYGAGPPVQRRELPGLSKSDFAQHALAAAEIRAAAARGTQGTATALPHLDRIQRAFGRHDVSRIRAYVGADAAASASAIGAQAYATGDQIAFAEAPGLELAAHEAAHVVQQRAGLQLAGGVGHAGDAHERAADEAAARVVAGESAEPVLDRYAAPAPTPSPGPGVQRRELHLQDGPVVTENLRRDQILALYKVLRRARHQLTGQLAAAIQAGEYQGAPIDLEHVRVQPRSLQKVIADHRNPEHPVDLHAEHTVGLEAEFGFHHSPILTYSHLVLARSASGAAIHGVPFKLETDAGSTVEVVTPPLWIEPDEEDPLKTELESFARASVANTISIAQWIRLANETYGMALVQVRADELRANLRYMTKDTDVGAADQQARSPSLVADIGETLLSPSQKSDSGAHAQLNKAVSMAEYGASRDAHFARIDRDFAPLLEDRDVLKRFLSQFEDRGVFLWDDSYADEATPVEPIYASIALANAYLRQMRQVEDDDMADPPKIDFNTTAYLWISHMHFVAQIFREHVNDVPPSMPNPFGVAPTDNTGPVSTLIGEKSVTGALGSIGEHLAATLMQRAHARRDASVFTVQPNDAVDAKKEKALARWHTHVKDILGTWFKGDLRQVLLNEKVGFRLAETPGALERAVMARWNGEIAAQLAPYIQLLETLGVTMQGTTITDVSAAWLELPLPDPGLYLREWEKTIRSICTLIEQVTAELKRSQVDAGFERPNLLENIDAHPYNAREDTLISSQYVTRFPDGGVHQYVVETR